MKYLLVLAVVLVAIYIWRNNRRLGNDGGTGKPGRPAGKPRKPTGPTVMVACPHCGTHLPETEAIKGRDGAYCSDEHRRLSEG